MDYANKIDMMDDDCDIEWFPIENINSFWINKMHCVDCGNLSEFYFHWNSICNTCKTKKDKESLYTFYFIWIPVFIFITYIIINLIIYAV